MLFIDRRDSVFCITGCIQRLNKKGCVQVIFSWHIFRFHPNVLFKNHSCINYIQNPHLSGLTPCEQTYWLSSALSIRLVLFHTCKQNTQESVVVFFLKGNLDRKVSYLHSTPPDSMHFVHTCVHTHTLFHTHTHTHTHSFTHTHTQTNTHRD